MGTGPKREVGSQQNGSQPGIAQRATRSWTACLVQELRLGRAAAAAPDPSRAELVARLRDDMDRGTFDPQVERLVDLLFQNLRAAV